MRDTRFSARPAPRRTLAGAALIVMVCLAGCSEKTPAEGAAPGAVAGDPAQAKPVANVGGGKALPPGAIRVKPAEIIDKQGFEKPMVAATILVPAGWLTEGGIQWKLDTNNCGGPAHSFNWRASAPDGSSALQLLPSETWKYTNYAPPKQGCVTSTAADIQQYLQWWAQRHRPGSRVLDYRQRKDKIPEKMAALNTVNRMPNMESRFWVDAGEMLLGFNDGQREFREIVFAQGFFTQMRMQMPANNQVLEERSGTVEGAYAMRAPDGALDFKRTDALVASFRAAPEWSERIRVGYAKMQQESADTQRKVAEINARTNAETLAHIAKRGEIAAAGRRDVADIQMKGWQSQQDSQDRMHRAKVETIREVHRYNDPQRGGTVELSYHYNHAWALKDGSYVLTDNPNFDPQRDVGVGGQEMQRAR